MGAGSSKPEDVQALAAQPADYKPPLGPPNPVRARLWAAVALSALYCL